MSEGVFIVVLLVGLIGFACVLTLVVLCLRALARPERTLDEDEARRAVAPVAPNVERRTHR